MSGSLRGRRMLVVGASAGIGRALAAHAIREGADVLAAARRADRLDELVADAGGGIPVVVDVADPEQVDRLRAVVAEGPALDVAITCAGVAPLRRIDDMTVDDWDTVLRTNVVGFDQMVRAVLPNLGPAAVVAALSSETVHQPRPGLAAYAASKCALEAVVRGWRLEHPGRRFSCIRVGATFPTEFGDAFDPDLLGPAVADWSARGLMQEEFMATDDVAGLLADLLASLVDRPGVSIDDIVLRSPSKVAGSVEHALAHAEARSDDRSPP